MKCPQCGNDNEEGARVCGACGTPLGGDAAGGIGAASTELPNVGFLQAFSPRFRNFLKVWLIGGLTGLATGLSWTLVENVLSTDGVFDGGEFCVSLVTPALAGIVVALATRSGIKTTLAVAYLTLLIPILGAGFGASGSEPLWQHGALGLGGGLFWSSPFAIGSLVHRRKSPVLVTIVAILLVVIVLLFTIDAAGEVFPDGELNWDEPGNEEVTDLGGMGTLGDGDESQAVDPDGDSRQTIFLAGFAEKIKVTPIVLEGEISRDTTYQAWSFDGDRGQVLRFVPRPKPQSNIDFEHVAMTLFAGQGDGEGDENAHSEVIALDEELQEIALPETGTYTLSVEGNPENSSGAYTITISSD
jgi:hypothetical protein